MLTATDRLKKNYSIDYFVVTDSIIDFASFVLVLLFLWLLILVLFVAAVVTAIGAVTAAAEKSKEMIISFSHGDLGNEVPNILIDGKVVERVDHVKLLGITLSNDLTWKRHVDNIVKKAGKRIYMLYQLKRAGVNKADLVTIYISVVRPVVEYACPVWHTNLPIYLSENIEMIQKRAVRV